MSKNITISGKGGMTAVLIHKGHGDQTFVYFNEIHVFKPLSYRSLLVLGEERKEEWSFTITPVFSQRSKMEKFPQTVSKAWQQKINAMLIKKAKESLFLEPDEYFWDVKIGGFTVNIRCDRV